MLLKDYFGNVKEALNMVFDMDIRILNECIKEDQESAKEMKAALETRGLQPEGIGINLNQGAILARQSEVRRIENYQKLINETFDECIKECKEESV